MGSKELSVDLQNRIELGKDKEKFLLLFMIQKNTVASTSLTWKMFEATNLSNLELAVQPK